MAEALQLAPMVAKNQDTKGTAFTVTCDAVGTTTGVGGTDRSFTFNRLATPSCTDKDFVRPGHIFPLIAKDEGVMERRGHTEASTDLCLLSGCNPVAVIGELTNDDGTMMRLPHVTRFAQRFGLKLITIEQMVQYRTAMGLTDALQRENASAGAVAERLAKLPSPAASAGAVPAYSAKQAGLSPANGRTQEEATEQKDGPAVPTSALGLSLKTKFPLRVVKDLKIGIVRALWNDELVSSLVAQTLDFECVSQSVSQGLMQVQLDTRVPVIYGVLNCLTEEQAQTRCSKDSPDARSLAHTAL